MILTQIPRMNPYPGKNLVLVLDNTAINQGKQVNQILQVEQINLTSLLPYFPELRFATIKSKLQITQELTLPWNPDGQFSKSV